MRDKNPANYYQSAMEMLFHTPRVSYMEVREDGVEAPTALEIPN